MCKPALRITLALVGGSLTPAVLGQSFIGMGLPPGVRECYATGVSGNGQVAVGYAIGAEYRAVRWTRAGGQQDLGVLPGSYASIAWGTNDDGTVIVGDCDDGRRAFRWTLAEGMVDLGVLPGATTAAASAVSGDGSVITGSSGGAGISTTFRWTATTGMQIIPPRPEWDECDSLAINGDGSVIVGIAFARDFVCGFIWSDTAGMRGLSGPYEGVAYASGVSRNGQVAVGVGSPGPTGEVAMRWVGYSSYDIGVSGECHATSGNGGVTVGQVTDSTPRQYAALWINNDTELDLNAYLPSLGIDLTDWTLDNATGISADGSTIVGWGTHNGQPEGWIATITIPCYANCDGSTTTPVLDVNDLVCFLQHFAAGDSYANCDHSTTPPTLNISDFACFLERFIVGCP
jgi:uncharacterized membrane protein